MECNIIKAVLIVLATLMVVIGEGVRVVGKTGLFTGDIAVVRVVSNSKPRTRG